VKITPVGAELFHEDRGDEAKSCFSQFCHRPKQRVSTDWREIGTATSAG